MRYVDSPRDVVRFRNTISITWPMIAGEVDLADFVVLEVLRLNEPELFQLIRQDRAMLCSYTIQSNKVTKEKRNETLERLIAITSDSRRLLAEGSILFLFPGIFREDRDNLGEIQKWDEYRRVCIGNHFDTYFRSTLSNESLPTDDTEQLVSRINDVSFIRKKLLEKASTTSETTMLINLLDTLTTYAKRVEKENTASFLSVLFSTYDEVDFLVDDRAISDAFTSITLLYHRLTKRLTENRYSINERTKLYLSAMESSSLGWTVNFVASLKDDYQSYKNSNLREKGKFRITEEAVAVFVEKALVQIHEAAADLSLLHHHQLSTILYKWWSFCDNTDEVRRWTNLVMKNDEAVVLFANALITRPEGELLSGRDEMDRTMKAQLEKEINVLDLVTFKEALERIQDKRSLDQDALSTVSSFLHIWDSTILPEDMFMSS